VRRATAFAIVFAFALSCGGAAGRGGAGGSGGSGGSGGRGSAAAGGAPSGSGGGVAGASAGVGGASGGVGGASGGAGGAEAEDAATNDASGAAGAGGKGGGGSGVPPPPPDGGTPAADAGASAWPAVTDYGATGPFPITRDVNTGPAGAYDVFRPSMLGAAGRKHPIVSWANGTLFSLTNYQKLLEHWASHGLVVIAGHSMSTAGGGTHKAGIDFMIAENARAGSPYFGVLDTAHVAAAGHSQGGGATIAAGAQKPGPIALTTTLPLMPILSFESDTSIVSKQTAPMFNINATMDTRDPTGAVAMQIYANAKTELVQAAFIGIHEDAMGPAMLAPTLAWFRLELMGDDAARPMFFPPGTCGLCTNTAWKQVRYQNVP
jgi:hypothetical protein